MEEEAAEAEETGYAALPGTAAAAAAVAIQVEHFSSAVESTGDEEVALPARSRLQLWLS